MSHPQAAASRLDHDQVELEARRERCTAADGGCEVLRAVRDCMLRGLDAPTWLRDEFVRRYSLVGDAHVATWDEAFGRPYPPRTRIDMVRRDRMRLRQVHEAVWSELRRDPRQAIDAQLFERAALASELACSGSTARNLYYRAINEQGLLNLASYKQAMLRQVDASLDALHGAIPVFPTKGWKAIDHSGGST